MAVDAIGFRTQWFDIKEPKVLTSMWQSSIENSSYDAEADQIVAKKKNGGRGSLRPGARTLPEPDVDTAEPIQEMEWPDTART
jgi:hypothetical protein